MTRRRALVAAAVTVAVVASSFALPRALRSIPVFRVRRVEVAGSRYLAADAVARALDLRPGASIFDPLPPLERRVFAVPGVARVDVARRIPGTLVITIEERQPVALVQRSGRLVPVDRRGRILPYDPAREAPDLPVAVVDTAVLGVVDRVRATDPALFASLVSAGRERGTVVLETAAHRLLFRAGASPREIAGLGIVLTEIQRRNIRVAEVDARFEGRVIVRGARST